MVVKMQTTLSCCEEGHDGYIDVNLELASTRITVSLEDDHLENDDDTITPATYPRTVAVELRPDGRLQVLVYGLDQDEPRVFMLDTKGKIEELA